MQPWAKDLGLEEEPPNETKEERKKRLVRNRSKIAYARRTGKIPPHQPGMSAEQRAHLGSVGVLPPPPPELVPKGARKVTRPVDYENIGGMCATLWFSGGETVFGEEWRPNETEAKQIPEAFTAYCRAKEIGDLPPGIALALALGVYTVARVSKPTVRERIGGFGGYVKGRWRRWREGR